MNATGNRKYRIFFLLLIVLWLMSVEIATAGEGDIPVRSVAQLTMDDDGRGLNHPSTVFYDRVGDEIYLVNAGTGRVVVYDRDFFPAVSIGVGRGVEAPRGGVVLENGEVYLLQIHNTKSARSRITILNAAFFLEREIYLDQIPEAANFVPRELAVSREGLIYVASNYSFGVLVLDNEGNFLRRLQPRDRTLFAAPEEETDTSEASEEVEKTDTDAAENQENAAEPAEEPADGPDIPEEYQPRGGRQGDEGGAREKLNPVRIGHVTIDSKGRIYLLSAQTSKIYVYGPDETFLFSFGKKGGSPRYLSQPRALAIDEKRGVIYVVDYMRHSILAYDMRGEYLFEFGGRGEGPGWFNFPEDLAINRHGQLIVADLFNKRAQVLEVEYDEFSPSQKERFGIVGAESSPTTGVPPSDEQIPPAPESEETPEAKDLPEDEPVPQETLEEQVVQQPEDLSGTELKSTE